jgi:DNA primase
VAARLPSGVWSVALSVPGQRGYRLDALDRRAVFVLVGSAVRRSAMDVFQAHVTGTTEERRQPARRWDVDRLKEVAIGDVARNLGLHLKAHSARCIHAERHSHGDSTPSMSLDVKRNRFKCFVCEDVRGDVIELVRQVRGFDFYTACQWLSETYGIPPVADNRRPRQRSTGLVDAIGQRLAYREEEVPPTPPQVCDVLEDLMSRCEVTHELLAYMAQRGWRDEAAEEYGIRAIKDPGVLFAELLRRHGLEALRAAGLVAQENSQFLFNRHRMLFSLVTRRSGRVEFVQGRRIGSDVKPKFCSCARPIPCLWNDLVLDELELDAELHVCEGIPDALTLCLHGIPAVAVLGSQNPNRYLIRMA